MKLEIKNIAKIEHAEIDIDGITVIAGSNNAGKSTIGKALFGMFDAFYRIDEFIKENKPNDVKILLNHHADNLNIICKQISGLKRKKTGLSREIQLKFARTYAICTSDEQIEHVTEDFCKEHLMLYGIEEYFGDKAVQSWIEETTTDLVDKILDYDSEYAVKKGVEDTFLAIFGRQLCKRKRKNEDNKENNKKDSEVSIRVNSADETTSRVNKVVFEKDAVKKVCQDFSVKTKALYIDDPNVVHNLAVLGMIGDKNSICSEIERNLRIGGIEASRAIDWRYFLRNYEDIFRYRQVLDEDRIENNEETTYDRKKLDELVDQINSDMREIVKGTMDFSIGNPLRYKDDAYDELFYLSNLSTGLKSLSLLQCILNYRALKRKSVLILDEPEIHLHPEWQVQYARYIVILQKYLDLHVVITTHSPFFMKAIENAALESDSYNKCHFYYTELEDGEVSIQNVDYDKELVYAKMMKPFMDMIGDMGL